MPRLKCVKSSEEASTSSLLPKSFPAVQWKQNISSGQSSPKKTKFQNQRVTRRLTTLPPLVFVSFCIQIKYQHTKSPAQTHLYTSSPKRTEQTSGFVIHCFLESLFPPVYTC